MRPLSRNKPPVEVSVQPRDCESCAAPAPIWSMHGRVDWGRRGRRGFTIPGTGVDPDTPSLKTYLTETETAEWSAAYTNNDPAGHPPTTDVYSASGSYTKVWTYTKSGHKRLISATGSASETETFSPDAGSVPRSYDRSASLVYDPATDTASWVSDGVMPTIGGMGGITADPVITETTTTRVTTGVYGSNTLINTLSDVFLDAAFVAEAEALLAAINLDDFDGLPLGRAVTARYDGDGLAASPSSAYDSAITSAEAEQAAATAEVAAAAAALAAAEAAVADAITTIAAQRAAEQTAWVAAMHARDEYEAILIRIETWQRRGDAGQAATASALLPAKKAAWDAAQLAWETARYAIQTTYPFVFAAGYRAQELAVATSNLKNVTAAVGLANANKAGSTSWDTIMRDYAFSYGGTGPFPSPDFSVQAYRQLHYESDGFLSRVALGKMSWRLALNAAPIWTKNPDTATLKWRQATMTYDADNIATGVAFTSAAEETITLSETDRFRLTAARDVVAPGAEGAAFIVGPSAKIDILIDSHVRGGSARKYGFPAYLPPAGKPRIYLRETASGSYPGCPLQSLPSKSYSGFHGYTGSPDHSASWQGPDEFHGDRPPIEALKFETTFSADVPEDRQSILPDARAYTAGVGTPIHLEFLDPGEITSAISRRWLALSKCGTTDVQDLMTLALSEEFTTASLKALVDPAAAQAWDTPEADVIQTPEHPGYAVAIRFLSTDEAYYARQKMRLRFSAQLAPWFFFFLRPDAPESFGLTWKKVTVDMVTGERTSENQSVTVSSDSVTAYAAALDLEADDGKMILALPGEGLDDPRSWTTPVWTPKAAG